METFNMPEDLQKKNVVAPEESDSAELAGLTDSADLADSGEDSGQEEQDDSIARAFAEINARLDEGMADFDERMKRINDMLPKDELERPVLPTSEPKTLASLMQKGQKGQQAEAEAEQEEEVFCETQAEPEPPLDPERAAKQLFLSEKVREAGRIGAGASWQLMLGFGISLALRVGILGVWLGSYIDRHWLGDTGIGAAVIIVLVIFYSFYMLYHDLMLLDKQNREEREKARQDAEEEWARRHGG
jgi:hypothetical protein